MTKLQIDPVSNLHNIFRDFVQDRSGKLQNLICLLKKETWKYFNELKLNTINKYFITNIIAILLLRI